MRKTVSIVNLPGLELFLFLFFFALFGWPIMTIVEKTHDSFIFVYIFMVWSIIVFLLALIARKRRPVRDGKNESGRMTDV